MTEVLFILTTIFVAYVAYALVSEQKAAAKTKAPTAQPEKKVVAEEQAKPKAVATKAKPAVAKAASPKAEATKAAVAPKPATTKAAAPKTAAKPAAPKVAAKKATTVATAPAAGLKDPKTGEVAKTYSNYRFTKRWIKEALVAEGLLDKVYTNNELDTATEAKIKSAIAQLESMAKYQA